MDKRGFHRPSKTEEICVQQEKGKVKINNVHPLSVVEGQFGYLVNNRWLSGRLGTALCLIFGHGF